MNILNNKLLALSVLMCVFVLAGQVQAAVNDMDQVVLHPAIPLLDEAGNHVLDSGNAYSSKMTCGTGGCHDYESITHAFHIEQGREETSDDFGALRGLSTLVGPGYYGGYNCMGGSNPDGLAKKNNATAADFGDLGSADFIMRCVSCHSGGGWMEKDRNGKRYDEVDITTVPMLDGDYYSRNTNAGTEVIDSHDHTTHDMDGIAAWDWKKSGVVENDCLMCHVKLDSLQIFDPLLNVEGASPAQTQFTTLRNTYLAKDAMFRSMNTSILEFLNLKHVDGVQEDMSVVTFERTTEIPADVHIHTRTVPPYILLKDYADQPLLNWNAAAFDENKKVSIPMVRFPANETCMTCHRTSNSRRGFYGFGEDATVDLDDDGTIIEDYQDDVHKGKIWTEPNGEARAIENCNACHTRNYFNPAYANVDLDASHNFLKGNSDMDVRNDLDYSPNAKSCEYCHNDAPNPAIPSGHESMLTAHLELWKFSGDLGGYPADTLERITQTHLDVVSCQACHITSKEVRSTELLPMYRYRASENGDLKIVPYNPKMRYYWKDNNSGISLTQTERNSVFEMRTDDDGVTYYGVIIDPETGAELGTVSASYSHGSWRFGDPEDYETFVALKSAYDKVFIGKGIENPNAVLVWTESNQYLMSHNTRPAIDSVQCVECHNVKQDGSFSTLVSPTGLLGAGNIKEITQLVDPRLVDEGLVIFDYPYMKADASGLVTENVSDILYASRINPSMSALNSEIVDVAAGEFREKLAAEAFTASGIDAAVAAVLFPGNEVLAYQARYGSSAIRGVALMVENNGQTKLTFPGYRAQVSLSSLDVMTGISDSGLGGLVSDSYSLQITDSNSNPVSNFSGARVLVKLPYKGSNTNLDEVRVIYTVDNINWLEINTDDIMVLKPHSEVEGEESEGMVVFWTDHFSDYAVVDSSITLTDTTQSTAATSSGGGSADYALILIGLFVTTLLRRGRRRNKV